MKTWMSLRVLSSQQIMMYNLSPFDNFLSCLFRKLVGVDDSIVSVDIDIIVFVDELYY